MPEKSYTVLKPETKAKVPLTFTEISSRLKALDLPPVDAVVGVSSGGTVPASLLAYQLDLPLYIIAINYRAEDNSPQRSAPELLRNFDTKNLPKRLLLVDDVSVTGQTLELAKSLLTGFEITTLVLKGKADFVIFPEVGSCVHWPWKLS
jgi:hypoxanthine phosphoribosyltransferase